MQRIIQYRATAEESLLKRFMDEAISYSLIAGKKILGNCTYCIKVDNFFFVYLGVFDIINMELVFGFTKYKLMDIVRSS